MDGVPGPVAAMVSTAVATGGLGLYLLMPGARQSTRSIGIGLGLLAFVLLWMIWGEKLGEAHWLQTAFFYPIATLTVLGAVMMVTSRNPVVSALWFACSVIGTAGLFFLENAQFLAAATIIVYAGAIIVMFLFVVMLAQRPGRAHHDRVSNDPERAVGFCFLLLALLAFAVVGSDTHWRPEPPAAGVSATARLPGPHDAAIAALGTELFAEYWVSLEVAGTLLLVAMVGAIVISAHRGTRRQVGAGKEVALSGGGEEPGGEPAC